MISRCLIALKKNNLRATIVRGISGWAIVDASGKVLVLITQVLLARMLGVEQYGVYIYVVVWIDVLVLLSKFGMDTTLVKYVSLYYAQQQWRYLAGILRSSAVLVLVVSTVVSSVAALVTWWLRESLGIDLTYTFLIGFISIPVLSIAKLEQEALRALKSIIRATLPKVVLPSLLMIMAIGFLVLYSGEYINSRMVMGLYVGTAVFSLFVSTFWLRQFLDQNVEKHKHLYDMHLWIRVALPLFLISGTNLILSQTDMLMIGALLPSEDVGIYSSALRFARLLSFGLSAVNGIAAPMFASLYAEERLKDLQDIARMAAGGVFLFTVPAGVVLIVCGRYLLGIFGDSFTLGYFALVILVAGQIINALAGSVGFLMTMTGHQDEAMFILVSGAVLNIALNAVLIPIWGINGASVATAVSTIFWNVLMYVHAQKYVGVDPTILSFFRTSRAERSV